MKISEMIVELQSQLNKHGDLDIMLINDEFESRHDAACVFFEAGSRETGFNTRVYENHNRVIIDSGQNEPN